MEIQNSKDWAKIYRACNFIEKGVCEYADERVYLSTETLQRACATIKGRPVIVDHTTGITPENMHQYAVGYVTEVECSFGDSSSLDCKFVIFDDEGKKVIADGYSVSCAYKPLAFGPGGTWHNVPYDREIVDLEFTHLALVQNPRYEDAKVYENAKDKDSQNGRWITVKGSRVFIKEGQSIEDAMKDRRKDKFSDQKTSKRKAKLEKIKNEVQSEIEKIYADYEDLKEYFVVDTKFKENYYDDGSDMYAIEVRGELDYKSMTQLGDKLDKMVQKYDKYAYFDQEEPGIMTAVIDFDNGVEKHNAKDRNGDEGRWITIKGTHVFIKDGQSVEEVIDQKFKGSEGHEAKRTSKIHQDIHDRYEALREETERQKKELKGKYEREDADFDEEQVLKDIEEARSFGYETIDDVAEFLGLDPDEVTGLTGESYGDDDFQFKTSSEYKSKKHPDGIVLDLVGKEELIKGFKEASKGQTISKELEDKLSKEMQKYSNLPGWSDKFEQMWDEIDDYHDQWKAQSSTNGSNWSKSKYGNDWQLGGDSGKYAKVSARKDDSYDVKIWDESTGKAAGEKKTFDSKEDAMKWAEDQLKSEASGAVDISKYEFKDFANPDGQTYKDGKRKTYRKTLEDVSQQIEDIYQRALKGGANAKAFAFDIDDALQHATFRDIPAKKVGGAKDAIYKRAHQLKEMFKKNQEKHNNKEDVMNVEEFFNKMGEVIEEKFNACKGKMNQAEEGEDDDDKFEMDGEVYSKKELVNAFKEKKNAEMAEEEDEEEEKQNSADEFFNAMEERMAQQQQEASDKIEVYSQQKGLEKGKKIYG